MSAAIIHKPLYPVNLYRVEFCYDYRRGDRIDFICQTLDEEVSAVYQVDSPLPAFPFYVVKLDINEHSAKLEDIDQSLQGIIEGCRHKAK